MFKISNKNNDEKEYIAQNIPETVKLWGRTDNGKEQIQIMTKVYLQKAVEYIRENETILGKGV